MPKQTPIVTLIKNAEKQVPGITVPDGVRSLRAFYEGVIACGRTRASERFRECRFKQGSSCFNDWNTGWITAQVLVIRQLKTKKYNFPFLKETG
ncbi:MAG: hypothetical protein ABJG33_04920 [Balneola sp.]